MVVVCLCSTASPTVQWQPVSSLELRLLMSHNVVCGMYYARTTVIDHWTVVSLPYMQRLPQSQHVTSICTGQVDTAIGLCCRNCMQHPPALSLPCINADESSLKRP
jgi:hypothetical protein